MPNVSLTKGHGSAAPYRALTPLPTRSLVRRVLDAMRDAAGGAR